MKRRIKWNKLKRRARKIILLAIMGVAFIYGVSSLAYLIETTGIVFFIFVICWTLIALFLAANKKVFL